MIDHVDVEVPIWLDLKWALSSPNRVSLLVCIWSLSITPTLVSRWTFDWLLLRWSGIYWLVVSLLIMLLFLHCLSLSIWSSFFCHKVVFLDLLQHSLNVGIGHRELLLYFVLSPDIIIYNSLMLLFVVCTFISLGVLWWFLRRSSAVDLLLRMVSFVRLKVYLLIFVVKCVVFEYLTDNLTDIVLVSEFLTKGCYSIKLGISHVIVPTDAGNSVLWLEHKCHWWVIHNNNICHRSSKSS